MPIPGIDVLLGRKISKKEIEDNNLFLLIGPRAVGKTTYCKTFLAESLANNNHVIYISSNIMLKQFRNFFPNVKSDAILSNSLFVNPFLKEDIDDLNIHNKLNIDNKLFSTLKEVEQRFLEIDKDSKNNKEQNSRIPDHLEKSKGKENLAYIDSSTSKDSYSNDIVLVLDSISHLCTIFDEKDVLRFINLLSLFLKSKGIKSIFTVNNLTLDENIIEKVSTLFDTILEMKIEEGKNTEDSKRMIRIASFTGEKIPSKWVNIHTNGNGRLLFQGPSSSKKVSLICSVCKKPITENPVFHQDMAFHKNHLEVYVKLHGIYGDSGMTNIGQSTVLNANFFFIDIVGLSNPLLSVRKQIQKIELLNNLISICPAFRKNTEKKVLATGDGMAIGFISNPEAPLELSIQLHNELRKHNENAFDDDSKLGIRIGLASGSVFIVNDINNNQNIWGPGIIFARRVMDIGDGWHILLEGALAENLILLDHKYKEIIHYIGDHQIKHGQVIKMYSAYDDKNFGNSELPQKFQSLTKKVAF